MYSNLIGEKRAIGIATFILSEAKKVNVELPALGKFVKEGLQSDNVYQPSQELHDKVNTQGGVRINYDDSNRIRDYFQSYIPTPFQIEVLKKHNPKSDNFMAKGGQTKSYLNKVLPLQYITGAICAPNGQTVVKMNRDVNTTPLSPVERSEMAKDIISSFNEKYGGSPDFKENEFAGGGSTSLRGKNTIYHIDKTTVDGKIENILKTTEFDKDQFQKIFDEAAKSLKVGEELEYQKEDDYEFSPAMLLVEMTANGLITYNSKGQKKKYYPKYEKGGSVSFDDKVNAITKSLTGTEVPRKYRKEYDDVYTETTARQAATKIAGAIKRNEGYAWGGSPIEGGGGVSQPVYAKGGIAGIKKYADDVDPIYSRVIAGLIVKKYLNPKDLDAMPFSSGGGFEHLLLKRPDGHYLMFNSTETGIALSDKTYKTSEEAYEAFWDSDAPEFQSSYIMIDNDDYSAKRPVSDIVDDVVKNNWKKFDSSRGFAKGGSVKMPEKGTPSWHQLQVAKKTLSYSDKGAAIMGGMTKEEAVKIVEKYEMKSDKYAKGGSTQFLDVYYIVYNPDTFKIIKTFKWYGRDIYDLLGGDPNARVPFNGKAWINVTHPKSQETLMKINEVNNTSYGKVEIKAKGGSLEKSEDLAKEYSRLVKRDLSKEEMEEVVAGNSYPDEHMDANITMHEAFINVMGRVFTFLDEDKPETESHNESDTDLMNMASAKAEQNKYYTSEKLSYPRKKEDIMLSSTDKKYKSKKIDELGEAVTMAEDLSMGGPATYTVTVNGKKFASAKSGSLTTEEGSFARGGSVKDIELPGINLWIRGFKMDTNGNQVVLVGFPNDRSFSIQTNGVLKETHHIAKSSKLKDLSNGDLKKISDEVYDYVSEYGSKDQKSRLKKYRSDADNRPEWKKPYQDEEDADWRYDKGGQVHSGEESGKLVFKADTRGGKYSYEVRKQSDGLYDIFEYTNGSQRGAGHNYKEESIREKISYSLQGSRDIDGINFIISVDELGIKDTYADGGTTGNHKVYYNGKVVDMGYIGNNKEQFKYAARRIADNLGTGGHTEDVGYIQTPDGKYYSVSRSYRSAKLLSGDEKEKAKEIMSQSEKTNESIDKWKHLKHYDSLSQFKNDPSSGWYKLSKEDKKLVQQYFKNK